MLELLLAVRSALSADEIEERTKHSAVEGTALAEALRASAKVDALADGRFRYKVPAWAVSACGGVHGFTKFCTSPGGWYDWQLLVRAGTSGALRCSNTA